MCKKIFLLSFISLNCFASLLQAQVNWRSMGYHRVSMVSPVVAVGDPIENATRIIALAKTASKDDAAIVQFPELSISGYTAEDLYLNTSFIEESLKQIKRVARETTSLDSLIVVGGPYAYKGKLLNAAFIIYHGKVLGVVPKIYRPNYAEFYEKRWFSRGNLKPIEVDDAILGPLTLGSRQLFQMDDGLVAGFEICEDLWAPIPPHKYLVLGGATYIGNLSASNALVGKKKFRGNLVSMASAESIAAYGYSAAGPSESTKDLVFEAHNIIAEDGSILAESTPEERFSLTRPVIKSADIDVSAIEFERRRNKTFASSQWQVKGLVFKTHQLKTTHQLNALNQISELRRVYPRNPFVPSNPADLNERTEEIFRMQSTGLAGKMLETHSQRMIIGISGGLDSTLALLVAMESVQKLQNEEKQRYLDEFGQEKPAFQIFWDPKRILGITMPGFGTTDLTKGSAIELMATLGVEAENISIAGISNAKFQALGHDPSVEDVVFENVQARSRTDVLFDRGNEAGKGGIVVGTGDLSELILGWCTYNGDQQSHYGVNSSVPKTLVRHLVKWWAENKADPRTKAVLMKILDTPVSPELTRPDAAGKIIQKTEDKLGPYEFHDFVTYFFRRKGFSFEKIYSLAREVFRGIYTDENMLKWLASEEKGKEGYMTRFYRTQFKRDNIPPGLKVGSVAVSPRGDLRLPTSAQCAWQIGRLKEFASRTATRK